ncbi:MAG TPA: NAD(P)-dependent oxidoreductase [Steroidobacteraceae bacterium]|nr:NAD(P)-dependent oxidoreductase [Steroidobacteraceae bacterium]
MTRIGFIGVGTMGAPMAANLVRKEFAVTLHDAASGRAAQVARELGCAATESLVGLADCDFVITMLPDGRAVQEVLTRAEDGALAKAVKRGTVFIDMSSSEPQLTRETGAELARRGLLLVDAPVSGARPRAEAGTLAIMVGCSPGELLRKITPVLTAMGGQLFVLGGLGNGHAMKAINNIVAGSTMVAVAEGLALGEDFGLDPAIMVEVLNASTGRSFVTELVAREHVIPGRFATGFALGLLAKDVRIAADLGEDLALDLPLFRLTRERFAYAREAEGLASDSSRAFVAFGASARLNRER